jgi:hypothetical protein
MAGALGVGDEPGDFDDCFYFETDATFGTAKWESETLDAIFGPSNRVFSTAMR